MPPACEALAMFATATLLEIVAHIERQLAAGARDVAIGVLDPDRAGGAYAGERVELDGVAYVHRPWRVWIDLAERLGLRMRTPRAATPPLVTVAFERLDASARLRGDGDDVTERYGADSPFARIDKLEDPGFVLDMRDALARCELPPDARILDLGVNTGDELALIQHVAPSLRDASFVGIDHSASAIAVARERFPRAVFHVAGLAALPALALGRFELVVSIGTLQSAGVDDRDVVRRVVQDHLAPNGRVIFGFPNCRYIDGEIEYGTRMKNFTQPELGLLVKDVAFYRKYLQQHHRRVFVTGKHYVLVTGVP